jgi:NMD protein affecting ribosome stability and mRNA decay
MVNFMKGKNKIVVCAQGCEQKFSIPVHVTSCTCPHCGKKLLLAYLGTIDGHFH